MANTPGGSGGFYNQLGGAMGAGMNGFYTSTTQPTTAAATNTGYYGHIQTPGSSPAPTAPSGGPAVHAWDGTAGEGAPGDDPGNTSYDTTPPIYAGNGTYGALGTNAPSNGIGNVSGGTPGATSSTPYSPTGAAPPSSPPTPGVLSGPGYGEDWYAQHGNDLSGKTNAQSIYDEGVSATNPYYQHAMDVTNQGINLAEAARGEGNSGAALAEIGNADATLMGQQALNQSNLAQSADTANTSQFTANSNAANNAETQTNNRINGAASAYTNLSNDQANMVDNFYKMAEDGQLQANMAGIEAQLAASGVDAATQQAIINDLTSVAGVAAKASSGK